MTARSAASEAPAMAVDGAAPRDLSTIAQIILAKLDRQQRAFILRMKPHQRDQRMTAAEWADVDCCVDSGTDFPDVYWFGGMRKTWHGGRARCVFRFSEVGLEARAALALADATS